MDNEREKKLTALRQAIIDHTKGEDLFWLGEALLVELEDQTGFALPRYDRPGEETSIQPIT